MLSGMFLPLRLRCNEGVLFVFRLFCLLLLGAMLSGCGIIEQQLFPVWEPNFFEESPAELGTFEVLERRVEVDDGADGRPFGITIFEPLGAAGPRPAFLWVMGSNVQAYYHQSLHETLASWGYVVLVPDTRPLRFTDFNYHNRIVLLAEQTLDLATAGELGANIDDTRIAAGGYSVGGPLAAFTAARAEQVSALVYWAPSGSPIWQGLSPGALYPKVNEKSLYILGEFDDSAPVDGGYPDEMQASMPAVFEEIVIAGASHHQFQQPVGADQFNTPPTITREQQQGIAIDATRTWLDEQFTLEDN